jgi:16S rRNA (guanine966-N2)-methyltransferase
MRVIAGSAGGIPLRIPNTDLRPTMDMVKGAIFSSLAEIVPGARVLDLFAGSGGLGIEALSRGAREALFIESDRRACACIEENLRKTRLAGTVHCNNVFDFLKHPTLHPPADLVFADPPYSKIRGGPDYALQLLSSPGLPNHLAPEALLVLEVFAGWSLPVDSPWDCSRRKKYGSTEILFLHPRMPAQDSAGSPEPREYSLGTSTDANPGEVRLKRHPVRGERHP